MSSLPNYLKTNRKRLALSQEEVGFLVGINGLGQGAKVCRDEKSTREPDLRTVLAYEAIYGTPIRDIFADLYEQVEKEVAERANTLRHRTTGKSTPQRQKAITNLVSKLTT